LLRFQVVCFIQGLAEAPQVAPVRLLLAVLAVCFVYVLGRNTGAMFRGAATAKGLYRWSLRATVALLAVLLTGGADVVAVVMLACAGLGGVVGLIRGRRPPKAPEDLSKLMFPRE
jgi:hypothetical protein